jgi:poly(A) polymerase
MKFTDKLMNLQIPFYYSSFSSLDLYYRISSSKFYFITIETSLIELAKLADNLIFPGLDFCDAVIIEEDIHIYIKCKEEDKFPNQPHPLLNLFYSAGEEKFFDPKGIYSFLKNIEFPAGVEKNNTVQSLWENAVLISRYRFPVPEKQVLNFDKNPLENKILRAILFLILTGPFPWKGLDYLLSTGFLPSYIPELSELVETNHSKENHPEGDAWLHTLETFRYRKNTDHLLSFALLLHDLGKPNSVRHKGKFFNGHADIGAEKAVKLLKRLEFPENFIRESAFLIRYHMLPGALKSIPLYRVEKIMASPLFPLLLELFRCDISSTFRGPEPYYEACKVYREFLKNRNNPFRTAEGKKLIRLYVE